MYIDAGILGDYDADLEADAVTVSGSLTFGVDGDGGLTVTPGETEVATENLELFGITDSFGLVDRLLGDTLAGTVEEELVGALDGLLEAQEDLRYLEFSGIAIVSDFVQVVHDDAGVTIFADSRIEVTEGPQPGDRLSTDVDFSSPSGATSPGGVDYQAGLFLDDDLLSALGAALSAGDLLEQDVAGDLGSLSLDTSLLAAIVPAFEERHRDCRSAFPHARRFPSWVRPVGPGSPASCISADWSSISRPTRLAMAPTMSS